MLHFLFFFKKIATSWQEERGVRQIIMAIILRALDVEHIPKQREAKQQC